MSETVQASPPPIKILIAEDSPTQALRLQHLLEQNGYEVAAARNGRLALEMAPAFGPALVISDVIMPEMNGYELSTRIKADPHLRHIPVILVTTMSDPKEVIRGLECGADNFVLKPYEEQYLLGRVHYVLVNCDVRREKDTGIAVEIFFNDRRHFITADRRQILNLLLSTYEAAVQHNRALRQSQKDLQVLISKLADANQELETFSYSVSHDLRSPLNAVDGFGHLLEHSDGDKLSDKGKHYLKRMRAGARQMNELIEGLLSLARFSREPLKTESVDLTAIAKRVEQIFRERDPQRQVRVDIQDGLLAQGDPRLLSAVVENLVGNAWKFTAKQTAARIVIGCDSGADGSPVYFVKDNGAGFDMAQVEKLFTAFERLHSTSEFAGTGIGLATVKRIITRHGGRIWAEGKVNEGATFYFTLGQEGGSGTQAG